MWGIDNTFNYAQIIRFICLRLIKYSLLNFRILESFEVKIKSGLVNLKYYEIFAKESILTQIAEVFEPIYDSNFVFILRKLKMRKVNVREQIELLGIITDLQDLICLELYPIRIKKELLVYYYKSIDGDILYIVWNSKNFNDEGHIDKNWGDAEYGPKKILISCICQIFGNYI